MDDGGMNEYLTVDEVALELRVSRMTIYRLVESGAITSHRFGRLLRITRDAVDAYIRDAQVHS